MILIDFNSFEIDKNTRLANPWLLGGVYPDETGIQPAVTFGSAKYRAVERMPERGVTQRALRASLRGRLT